MRRFALPALGIAAYLVFVLALTPAGFVANRIEKASDGRVQVRDASGTIWRGSAQATVSTPLGPFSLEHVQWRFLPMQLLRGQVLYSIHGGGHDYKIAGDVGRSPLGWRIPSFGLSVTTPSNVLPLLASWRPEGALDVDFANVTLTSNGLTGHVKARWKDAALAISEVRPLGSYAAEIRGDGGPARITLTTLDGPLRLAGQGTFTAPAKLVFKGEARAEGSSVEKLQGVLDLLGPRRPDGAREIQIVVNAP